MICTPSCPEESVSAPCTAKKTKTAEPECAALEVLRVKKLSPNATLPRRGSPQAAGFDLCRYPPPPALPPALLIPCV